MAQSPSSTSAADDLVGSVPESPWIPFIKEHYPSLLTETNFFPPIHFSHTPQTVVTIAGQTVHVRDNPPRSFGRSKEQPVPQADLFSGRIFVENSPRSASVYVQDSDLQDDRTFQRCLSALSDIPSQTMMVISSLRFKKYLSNINPLYSTAISQLPTLQDPSLPQHIKNSECDLVIIHRDYGFVIGEMKSVGASSYFNAGSPEMQSKIIIKQLEKAVIQLENQAKVLRHLVSDLPPVRITSTVLLPNISSAQLRSALSTTPSLLQKVTQVLSLPLDVDQAVRRCFCQDDLQNPADWWQGLHTAGVDPYMTEHLFTRLVARFCGPATSVEVPTAGPPRKVLRSMGQAVAETGFRFSSLVLTPSQVDLLNRQPEPQYLRIEGPPGTGKTVVLFLKALQWARQGRRVVIVSWVEDGRAVSLLLKEQLSTMVGPAEAANIQHYCCDFRKQDFNAGADVSRLRQQTGPGPFSILVDEVHSRYHKDEYLHWLREVRNQLPDVSVWSAGVWRFDMDLEDESLFDWLEMRTLQEALRCPPTVTTMLQQSEEVQYNLVLPYTDPQHPAPTQGPPVKKMQHEGQPGHSPGHPSQCDRCADHVLDYITNQLRVGQPDHGLQYRDVFILYHRSHPRADDVMVRLLQQRGLPVRTVTSNPLSEDDTRELALAVSDVITVAHWECVHGLERRVVVVLQARGMYGLSLLPCSRCSSALYLID